MARFVADYSRPDGSAPQIGDNDSGRLHPLSIRSRTDHLYLPRVAAQVLNQPDLNVDGSDPEVWWWTGTHPVTKAEKRRSKAFRDPGFYILRTDDLNVFVSGARVGMCGYGSHSHNDLLSFEYWAFGQSWITDPGTYVYTPDPDARNLFRSTAFHNSVRIDEREINPIRSGHLFQLPDRARVTTHSWDSNEETDILDLEHDGFVINESGGYHRRRFRLEKADRILSITDTLRASGRHRLEWFFNLHPSVVPTINGNTLEMHGTNATLIVSKSPRLSCCIRPSWYSPSYGIRTRTLQVVLTFEGELPLTTELLIAPARTRGAVH
jgi:uncharacterized heparinase superfamily protein